MGNTSLVTASQDVYIVGDSSDSNVSWKLGDVEPFAQISAYAPKWTYMFFRYKTLRDELDYHTLESFRQFGLDGWELASNTAVHLGQTSEFLAVFKRIQND